MTAADLDAEALERAAGRLDAAMSRIAELDDGPREAVEEALAALNDLHRDGLTTVVRRLRDDERGRELLYALVDEPEVRMLLSMHGIIRPDPTTLAQQVLTQVRPGLQSHGGDVELDRIADGVAYVRLHGACNGCSMASVTMRDSVEEALRAGVPGLTSVEVLPNDPSPTLIPVDSLTVRPAEAGDAAEAEATGLRAAGWAAVADEGALAPGELRTASLPVPDGPAVSVLVVHAGGGLAAYVNECAHQGRPLDDALVDATEGTLTCPGHGLCYDATSGECLTLPGAQLAPLPLRVAAGRVWVRPDGSAPGGGG